MCGTLIPPRYDYLLGAFFSHGTDLTPDISLTVCCELWCQLSSCSTRNSAPVVVIKVKLSVEWALDAVVFDVCVHVSGIRVEFVEGSGLVSKVKLNC